MGELDDDDDDCRAAAICFVKRAKFALQICLAPHSSSSSSSSSIVLTCFLAEISVFARFFIQKTISGSKFRCTSCTLDNYYEGQHPFCNAYRKVIDDDDELCLFNHHPIIIEFYGGMK